MISVNQSNNPFWRGTHTVPIDGALLQSVGGQEEVWRWGQRDPITDAMNVRHERPNPGKIRCTAVRFV